MEDKKTEKLLNLLGFDGVVTSVNKNLNSFVTKDTAEKLIKESERGLLDLLTICGEDTNRNGLQETPFRVIKAFIEYSEGYREDPKKHLEKTFDVDHHDLVLVKDIPFNSMCEHHLAPFVGKVHIAYIPSDKITGLSKFGRLVDGFAKRFQVQERLTQQIADSIQEVLTPKGVAVIIEAEHTCMSGRGIKKHGSSTVTSTMRGVFEDDSALRTELMLLIKGGK